MLVPENSFDQLRDELREIKEVQKELLKQLVYQRDDIGSLMTHWGNGRINLRSSFPCHPAGSTEEFQTLESFICSEDNYKNFVSIFFVYF